MAPTPGHGRLRASHADREHVVDVLKAAFVQGQLTQDELETRVGRALAALTSSLAALTSGPSPAGPFRTRPGPPRRPENGLLAVGPAG